MHPVRSKSIGLLLHKALTCACLFILLAMASLTCLDVIARYLFNSPIDGAYELTEIFLATLIFLALPLTTLAGEHIEVELIEPLGRGILSSVFKWITAFISMAVLGVLSYQVMLHAIKLFERGHVTNSLDIPLYLVGILASVSLGISALFVVLLTLRKV